MCCLALRDIVFAFKIRISDHIHENIIKDIARHCLRVHTVALFIYTVAEILAQSKNRPRTIEQISVYRHQ